MAVHPSTLAATDIATDIAEIGTATVTCPGCLESGIDIQDCYRCPGCAQYFCDLCVVGEDCANPEHAHFDDFGGNRACLACADDLACVVVEEEPCRCYGFTCYC